MPTDDELVTALRRGMQATTDNLNPVPGLAAEVRRQSDKARGLGIAAYFVVPVVAGAAVATALLAGGSPSGTTAPVAEGASLVAVAPTTPPRPGPTTPAAIATFATYRFADIAPVPSCPADTNGETIGKTDTGVWYLTPEGTCIGIGVDWADSKPSTAEPINVAGYPDLYATTTGGTQKIYAWIAPGENSDHPTGGWVVLTASADAPTDDVVKLIIVPSN